MQKPPNPIPIAQQADRGEPTAALRALVRALARQAAAELMAGMRAAPTPEPADAEIPAQTHRPLADR